MNAWTASLPALPLHFGQSASGWRRLLRAGPSGGGPVRRLPSHRLLPLQTEFVDTRPAWK